MGVTGEGLLAGVRVVDLAEEPAQMAGRILADLGATVLKVEPPAGDPLRSHPLRFSAWNAGKESVVASGPDDEVLRDALAWADVVIDTPGWPGSWDLDPALAPRSVWVSVTPFGREGPRSSWRASDLGVLASSGNMYCTGDPDRAPLRCTEPSSYAHTGPEAVVAALTGLASGRAQRVDVSMQETVLVANMGAVARFAKTGFRGRRTGAQTGRTREIWPCKDGFVSFGLRGGKARQANLETIARLVGDPVLTERDWSAYSHLTATDEELRAIEEPIAGWFAERTMSELYAVACETNLMLAPANSPRELYESEQLAARRFFGPLGDVEQFPLSFVQVRSADGLAAPAVPRSPSPALGSLASASLSSVLAVDAPPKRDVSTAGTDGGGGGGGEGGAWAGTRIVEFGSGAAGPIATRYFAEHGATVVRVESKTRPDFLRTYALGPGNPHGLEGSDMFDALNAGKLGLTLNLKHPRGVELARRVIVEWADAVSENFAPKAMRGFGLDYDSVVADKPDLVMVSACLQGQTGPHRNYPGFGGQGSALSGYNFLTGWPDREPLGPHGTITDSLAPRFVAAALAAGLLYRRRTGRGVYLDLSQVEAAAWSLSPWLLHWHVNGTLIERIGNRSLRTSPHGAFPCAGDDRWVAIAVWDDAEWERLAKVVGIDERPASEDDVEAAIAAWTSTRTPGEAAETLQAAGVEAVPVADFADLQDDPQLALRGHFVGLTHPVMGPGLYERNGFRLSGAPGGYARTGPTLGQDNAHLLGDVLGLSEPEQEALAADGVLD